MISDCQARVSDPSRAVLVNTCASTGGSSCTWYEARPPSSSTLGPTLPGNFNGSAVFSLPYLSLVPNFLSLIPSDFISMKAAVPLSPPQNFSKARLTVWPYGAPPKVLSVMGRGRRQKDSWQPRATTHPCPPSTTPPLLSCPTSRELIMQPGSGTADF